MLTIRKLDSGYWRLQGSGICEWAQPPEWPCDEATLRAHAFPEASEEFIRECLRYAEAVDDMPAHLAELVCRGCGQEIDPETCGCGASREHHGSPMDEGHSFVPMGCDCMRIVSPKRTREVEG